MSEKFEIVFSFDTTGSMYSCLKEVRRKLGDMVQTLKSKIPGIRIAIFAHGDYCDKDSTYVTKHINFTTNVDSLCNFAQNASATYGGDYPECYELVMREAQEYLSWSAGSQRALVIIGDAPPHEASEEQNYRSLDWKTETTKLRDMGIKVYAVQCEASSNDCEDFYQYIAARSFGYYMPLDDFNKVKEVLMDICFREAGIGGTSISYSASTPRPPSPKADDDDDDDEWTEDEGVGLRCYKCSVMKLSEEFPPTTVTNECDHNSGICLRCVVDHVEKTGTCPQCGGAAEREGDQMKWFQSILDQKFLDYSQSLGPGLLGLIAATPLIAANRLKSLEGRAVITVSTLTGDTAWINFDPEMTVAQLKLEVEKELKFTPNQQKLLFNDSGLKTNKGSGRPYRLKDFGITINASLHLIVPLYCVPEDLDHVVFDLCWHFPRGYTDFLDASCMAFEKSEFIQLIDWNHPKNAYYLKEAVVHSEKNEASGGMGHQKIEVRLKRVPSNISHLYFILSSWRSPNLSAFSDPTLQFYEASDPGTNLCGTTVGHALKSQAVIMCSLVRAGSQWQIYECDTDGLVDGNSKKYNPIRERIEKLIKDSSAY